MKILLNNQTLIKKLGPFSDIGFVPTMGRIHDGHISLIKRSIKSKKPLVLRNPNNTRPWQHVFEVIVGYLKITKLMNKNFFNIERVFKYLLNIS